MIKDFKQSVFQLREAKSRLPSHTMKLAKRFFLTTLAVAAFTGSALAAPEIHEIDATHSTIGFKVKHLFSFATGRFTNITGTITADEKKPENSRVDVTIQVGSINTDNDKRDDHLRSPDFFNSTQFPTITFASKSVKQTGPTTADVIGDLTLHGVTKEVPLKVTFLGKGPGMFGEIRSGWQATTTLKRSDFGLTWSKLVEGTQVVGDEVTVTLDIEAIKK